MGETNRVNELEQKIELLMTQVNEQTAKIAKLEALNEYYKTQFLLLKRLQFGAFSEKTAIESDGYRQMVLFNEAEVDKKMLEPEVDCYL